MGKGKLLHGPSAVAVGEGHADEMVAVGQVLAGECHLHDADLGRHLVYHLPGDDPVGVFLAGQRDVEPRVARERLQHPVISLDHHFSAV